MKWINCQAVEVLKARKTQGGDEMRQMKAVDPGSIVVMVVTLILFIAALFTKGFTHDLLLEAGVFLVSVKLILMAYRNTVTAKDLQRELQEIKAILLSRSSAGPSGPEG